LDLFKTYIASMYSKHSFVTTLRPKFTLQVSISGVFYTARNGFWVGVSQTTLNKIMP